MSGVLSSLGQSVASELGLPALSTDWRSRLRPASFRGVPFYVRGHEETGGRRAVAHEFPFMTTVVTEDLGPAKRTLTFDAYVVGEDYDLSRDALRKALFNVPGRGLLVHPYLGSMWVQVLPGCSVRESRDDGGIAVFRLMFVVSGDQTIPEDDTAAGILNELSTLISALKAGFALAALIATHPNFLLQAMAAGLSSFGEGLLGLPVGTIADVRSTISGLSDLADDTTETAAGVAAAMQAAVDATVADPPAGDDITGGIASLATWNGAVWPVSAATPGRAQEQTNAQALTDLVRGTAVAGVAEIVANTDFSSADQAEAMRTTLLDLIDARLLAAATAGDSDSYAAWQALAAAASADLIARAQALPSRASYSVGRSLPAVVLAYRLYGAIDQAEALADLNGATHPLFMPPSGVWLEPS